jgi:UDP-glucuronate 4-epimerase
MKVLVTGLAGFIGFHLARILAARGDEIVGIDNLNAYYDLSLKEARLEALTSLPGVRFVRLDLVEKSALADLFARERFDAVVNLAAQAGVRYSLTNPGAYVQSNVVGFLNLLEACRASPVRHLVYASSSSVYGANAKIPFSTRDTVDQPVSLYAATKKTDELMAHTYSHLFGVPTTGLRFFTVYGPWGRPDMAPMLFTKAILEGRPIEVFNHGEMYRDFTYIDDVVEGVVRVLDQPPAGEGVPYRIYNIGRGAPVRLMDFIGELEKSLGRSAQKNFLPIQPGDVASTHADITDLERDFGYRPKTPLSVGIGRFVEWYRDFFPAP